MKRKVLYGLLATGAIVAYQAQADLINFSNYSISTDLTAPPNNTASLSFGTTMTFVGNGASYSWQTWSGDHPDHTGDAADMLGQAANGVSLSFSAPVEVPSLWLDFNHQNTPYGVPDDVDLYVTGLSGGSQVWSQELQLTPADDATAGGTTLWHELTDGTGQNIDTLVFNAYDSSGSPANWAPDVDDITVLNAVPEPATMSLLLMSVAGLGLVLRRKK